MAKKIVNGKSAKYDLIVIGGGGAGLAAAAEAAEHGLKVLVVEKRRNPGGNANMAEGFFAAASPVQERQMVDASRDEMFRKAMDYYHGAVDARILRAYINKSADTIRWLEKKGLEFTVAPTLRNQCPLVWHVLPKRGKAIVKTLLEAGTAHGLEVKYGTTAKQILKDNSGRVNGILAQSPDGEERLTARAVVIATGGYGGNRELLQKSFPWDVTNLRCNGLPHMGEGIQIAWEAGAASGELGNIIGGGPCLSGMRGWAGASMYLTAIAEEPNTLWINKRGERFTDECITFNPFEAVNPLLRQPEMLTYSLFDERVKRGIEENGIIRGVGIYFMPPRSKVPGLDGILQDAGQKGTLKIADSWEEIADWMGLSPAVLKTTLEEYNSACEKGYDGVFNKDRRYLQPLTEPPFYAIPGYPFFMTTIGGIKINHRMEALDCQDSPIPGLYAAGMDAGGWVSGTYCGHLAGSGLGFALNSGRLAAESVRNYIS